MGCMCDTCFTIDKRKYRSNLWCKNPDCDGWIVQIDEVILPTISLLNKKGYITEHCCSGHSWEKSCCNIYISFDKSIVLPYLPFGFNYDKDLYPHVDWNRGNNGKAIRKNIDENLNEQNKQREILVSALDLLNWAEGVVNLYEDKEEIIG
jgi:hypothetical protein